MAITIQTANTVSWAGVQDSVSPFGKTVPVTVSAGTNLALFVTISNNVPDYTVTYGGVALTKVVTQPFQQNSSHCVWMLASPPVGTANLFVGRSSWSLSYWQMTAIVADDVHQTAAIGTEANNSNSFAASPISTAAVASAGELTLLMAGVNGASAITGDAGQVQAGNASPNGIRFYHGYKVGASTTAGISWTSSPSEQVTLAAVQIKSATAAALPPTLSSPTGTKTGTTTASGTVTTTEIGGTLYYRATTNDNESAATVKAGSSITVDALNESVSLTGLAAATTYRIHYLHTGANGDSAVVSSGTFTTDASTDSTAPTMNGSITVGTVASTSIQISWIAASDNVAVTSYETSTDGSTWTDRGNVLTYTFAGLTASTSYTLRVRAKDAAGNVAATPLQVTQSTAAAGASGTFTSGALSRNNGSPVVSTSLTWLTLLAESSGAFVTTKTNVAVNPSGIFTVASDAAMTPGTAYRATWKEVTGEAGQGTAVAT